MEKFRLERMKGIEPSSSVWKTDALPLSYTRKRLYYYTKYERKQKYLILELNAIPYLNSV
jgi:hypothetical protein